MELSSLLNCLVLLELSSRNGWGLLARGSLHCRQCSVTQQETGSGKEMGELQMLPWETLEGTATLSRTSAGPPMAGSSSPVGWRMPEQEGAPGTALLGTEPQGMEDSGHGGLGFGAAVVIPGDTGAGLSSVPLLPAQGRRQNELCMELSGCRSCNGQGLARETWVWAAGGALGKLRAFWGAGKFSRSCVLQQPSPGPVPQGKVRN